MPKVVVFGSLNMDLVAQTPRLPKAGETILGHQLLTIPGGKGANQAVATARLGIPTVMVGCVGGDDFGQTLLKGLRQEGIDTTGIRIDPTCTSGVALIAVDDRAENTIIVIPGANGQIGQTDLGILRSSLVNADVLLVQLEIPLPAVQAAAQIAHEMGVQVWLDPAPAPTSLPSELYPLVDMLLPNAGEASQLVGFSVVDPVTAAQAAQVFHGRGVGTIVLKLGVQGAFYSSSEQSGFLPAFPVAAVDTVAAGDAFAAGLVTALLNDRPLPQAVIWGNAAGALATLRSGAQSSLPDRSTLVEFLATAHPSALPTQ